LRIAMALEGHAGGEGRAEGGRRRKSAKERREQARRAEARTVVRLLRALESVRDHRGGNLGPLGLALLSALRKGDLVGEDVDEKPSELRKPPVEKPGELEQNDEQGSVVVAEQAADFAHDQKVMEDELQVYLKRCFKGFRSHTVSDMECTIFVGARSHMDTQLAEHVAEFNFFGLLVSAFGEKYLFNRVTVDVVCMDEEPVKELLKKPQGVMEEQRGGVEVPSGNDVGPPPKVAKMTPANIEKYDVSMGVDGKRAAEARGELAAVLRGHTDDPAVRRSPRDSKAKWLKAKSGRKKLGK
jgi:hypothetical protein